jgi:hypothetical protein
MGNQASTYNSELVDTSVEDWHGRKYGADAHYDANDDWAPQPEESFDDRNEMYEREATSEISDVDNVREKSALGLDPLVQTTAAVFHMNMMEQSDDDDISVSQRSAAVFEHLEEEAQQGNHRPFLKLLETASAISNMLTGSTGSFDDAGSATGSEQSAGDLFKMLGEQASDVIDVEKIQAGAGAVFELLDKVKSVDENQVAEFSSAVFGMLDEARSFGGQAPAERKFNIFRMLEENNLRSPLSQVDESAEADEYYGSAQYEREDYPEVGGNYEAPDYNEGDASFDQDISVLENFPGDDSSSIKRNVPVETVEGDAIDLVFVQDFDNAFNEFIGQNPRFLLKSPDLVHSIRVSKLQKLLGFMSVKERSVLTDVAKLKANKQGMEDSYQTLLRDASRGKAARQIYFQAELEKVGMISKTLEAKFKWATVALAEARTKKHQVMRLRYAEETPAASREQLLARLPRDIPGQNVLRTIQEVNTSDSSPTLTHSERSDAIQKLQVDIAFLSSEVKIWQKKLEILEAEKQKVAWIESILQKMTEKQMSKLKSKYQKKVGVQFD